jgi:hypothetical protein
VSLELCDELEGGFGWIEPGFMRRASHALEVEGRVLVFDPVDAREHDERILALGEPEAVVQLIDRHERDCAAVASRLGVPHLEMRLPEGFVGCELVPVLWSRFWREVACWCPGRRVLVVADALGTAPYFRARGERLGVHPFLRLVPPTSLRDMARGLTPGHILCGHGEGIHGEEASLAFAEALTTARRRLGPWLAGQVRRKR